MGNNKVKFILNREGVKDLMRSHEMAMVCLDYAHKALAQLGEGYEVNTYLGETRFNAEVKAESIQAKRENLENNTILKALGG